MKFLDLLIERFRPELPAKQEIVEREKRANSSRKKWILNHVYLSEGDLKQLELETKEGFAYYASPDEKNARFRCKRVKVSIPAKGNSKEKAEEKLKLELHYRGCNAGVFYRLSQRDGSLYAEAVPAIISS